ncbi:MAG TPA: hypothetical protein VK791_07060 [bacterium]|jgi:hypothetical protein|nr:hypothetical protein [bacterium]
MRNQKYAYWGILCLVFFASIGLGYGAWNYIALPFSNPLEVVGPPTVAGLNPYDGILRFGFFIFLPVVSLSALYFGKPAGFKKRIPAWLPQKSDSEAGKTRFFSKFNFLLAGFALLLALNIPTYHAFGRFDQFHEGESLGTAISLMDNQVPYRDFFFFHGVIQDPERSVWAFSLFGQSIGAQRTIESTFKVMTWILLAFFFARYFSTNRVLALTALLATAVFSVPFLFDVGVEPFVSPHDPQNIVSVFMKWEPWLSSLHWIILSGRDLLSVGFLFALLFILEEVRRHEPRENKLVLVLPVFCFSFVPWLALAHSVDRGIYLLAAGCIFSVWFILGFRKKRDFLRSYVLGASVGCATGFVVLGYFLKWNYSGFVQFVFIDLPRYKLLTDELTYPIHDPRFVLVLLILAFYLFRLFEKMLRMVLGSKLSLGNTLTTLLLEDGIQIALLMLSLFCFRNVLERPVLDHLAYNFLWVFLLILFDIFKLVSPVAKDEFLSKWMMAARFLSFIFVALTLYRLVEFDQWGRNFPLKTDDAAFISDNQSQVTAFLKKELKDGEPFFAFSNDASWYYLLNRPCPTAYPSLWVASPKVLQMRVVESLEQKKIRLILYKNSHWSSSIDDIPDTQRFPVINSYIRDRYKPYKKIADQEIWLRNN